MPSLDVNQVLLHAFSREIWLQSLRPLGSPGCSLPTFHTVLLVAAEDTDLLAHYGIEIEGDPGVENKVIIDTNQTKLSLKCRISACSNTVIIIGPGEPFGGRLAFNGQNSLFISSGMGRMGPPNTIRLTLGTGSAAFFGSGFTSVSSDWIIEGSDKILIVGDDNMVSWGVAVRNYDSHALFDIQTGRILNSPQSLVIGPHCWLGQDAMILRGVVIGHGSVIGAGSIVVGDVPACCAVAGIPAKTVRTDVSWTRSPKPSIPYIRDITKLLAGYSIEEPRDSSEQM